MADRHEFAQRGPFLVEALVLDGAEDVFGDLVAAADDLVRTAHVQHFVLGRHQFLKDLLPRGVATQIFTALLENAASEQGARMSAMDNATRNAGEMIDKLTLSYNRQRQAQITKELIEIISGAEAL